jgi:uncharacterized integral membrane protein
MPEPPSQPAGSPPLPPPPPPAQRKHPSTERDIPWRLILLGAVTIYAVLFAALNSEEVRVHFVFFSTTTSLIVVMVIGILLGAVGGYLFRELRSRRRRTSAAGASTR